MQVNEIQKHLIDLGTNANDIADRLNQLHCRGHVINPGKCPIAHFIRRLLGDTLTDNTSIIVGPTQIKIRDMDKVDEVLLPVAIQQFILKFDTKAYPQLVWN